MRISDWSSDVCSSDQEPTHPSSFQTMRKSLREVFYRVGGDFSAYLSVWPLLRLPDRRETRRSVPSESESHPVTPNGRRISWWFSDGRSADRTRFLSCTTEERHVGDECVSTC